MNTKRLFATLLTLVMVISLFAGCDINHDHDPTTEPTEVITDPTGEVTTDPTVDETEAHVETTVPEKTVEPTEAPTEAPTETPAKEPEADETEPVHQHSYSKKVTTPPTCSYGGEATYTCSCGASYTEAVPKNEHKWSDWVVTKEPTETTYGKKVRTCELCHGAQEANIDPLPADETEPVHQHSYSSKVTKAATCTEDGVKTFTCSCGASYTEAIAKTGHSWSNWVVTKEPTTSAEGVETRTCSVCKATETRSVDKLPADDDDDTITDCEEHGWRHTLSAADKAKITRGDDYYDIKCMCGLHCRASTRDGALAKFNAHAAEKKYDYCGEIMTEYEGHYHNIPSGTVTCAVCGKTVAFSDCGIGCYGTNDDDCPYD